MDKLYVFDGINESAQKRRADVLASDGNEVELHFHRATTAHGVYECNLKCIRFIPTSTTPIMQFIITKPEEEKE